MAGELTRLDTEIARLTELRASTHKTHAACVRTLSVITGPLTNVDLPTVFRIALTAGVAVCSDS